MRCPTRIHNTSGSGRRARREGAPIHNAVWSRRAGCGVPDDQPVITSDAVPKRDGGAVSVDQASGAGDDRRTRRDLIWNLAPVVLLAVVGLGLKLLIGRPGWWGKAALGVFNLVTISWFAFAVLGAFGLQYAVLRAVAEEPDDRDRVAAVVVGALIPTVVLAALTTGLYLLSAPLFGALQGAAVAEGMRWAAPGLFCFAVNKVLLGVVNGLRRMRAFAIYTSLRYVLIAAGLLLARWWRVDAARLPGIWTVSEGALLFALLGELGATVRLARGAGWTAWARRHLAFGARGVAATFAGEVNTKLDVWLLGIAVSNAQVGIYALASALFEGVLQLAIALQNLVNPVLARQISAGAHGEAAEVVRRTRRWFVPSLSAAALLGAVTYPLLIPPLIGDPDFIAGAWPFAILMVGIALASPYLPFNQVLLMAALPGWHTGYILATIAVSFAGNAALIPLLGMRGAALAAAASLALSAQLLRVLVRSRVGLRI
jgi:O-antigen/teichoic acid export membrane protein